MCYLMTKTAKSTYHCKGRIFMGVCICIAFHVVFRELLFHTLVNFFEEHGIRLTGDTENFRSGVTDACRQEDPRVVNSGSLEVRRVRTGSNQGRMRGVRGKSILVNDLEQHLKYVSQYDGVEIMRTWIVGSCWYEENDKKTKTSHHNKSLYTPAKPLPKVSCNRKSD